MAMAVARAERARVEKHTREPHKLCTAREVVCDLAPLVIRQVKHVVLSLGFGGHINAFRVALRRALHIVRAARPSPSTLSPEDGPLKCVLASEPGQSPQHSPCALASDLALV